MEFKERLKKLRGKRGVSQESLAKSIYVSRSAVAKWENGLGLPGRSSYETLLLYFDISETELPLCDNDEIMVSKNKRIRMLTELLIYVAVTIIIYTVCRVYFAHKDGFGFTSEMAAGRWWRDEACIKTEDYDFYYDTLNDGEGNPVIIDTFAVVDKEGLFYKRVEIDEIYTRVRSVTGENGYEGRLYTFRGDNVYYHIFRSTYRTGETGFPSITLLGESVSSDGTEYSVTLNSFFTTPRDIESFVSFDREFFIENSRG